MRRVMIIGSVGSGKSTLGTALGHLLALPIIHLDLIVWRPGCQTIPDDEFVAIHNNILLREEWIIEGVGPWQTWSARIAAADTIIFARLQRLASVVLSHEASASHDRQAPPPHAPRLLAPPYDRQVAAPGLDLSTRDAPGDRNPYPRGRGTGQNDPPLPRPGDDAALPTRIGARSLNQSPGEAYMPDAENHVAFIGNSV